MQYRKARWSRAVVPAAVLALALTACGPEENEGDANAQDTNETGQQETDGAEDDGRGDEEPAGNEGSMGLGDTSGPLPFEHRDATADFEVTVEKVDTGTHQELLDSGAFTEDKVEGLKPVFVHMTFTHVGGDALDQARMFSNTTVNTGDGGRATAVIAIGDLDLPGGCDPEAGYEDWSEGDEATECKTFLVPEGTDAAEVVWRADDGTEVTWKVG